MKIEKRGFARRFTASIVLALFMSQVSMPVWGTGGAWAAAIPLESVSTRAVLKSETVLDETDLTSGGARKANVLFLVEASAVMGYSPQGVQPVTVRDWDWYNNEEAINWKQTLEVYGLRFDDINNLNKDFTFGIGMLPPAWEGRNLRKERNLYGRDLDNGSYSATGWGNNYVKKSDNIEEDLKENANNYYFPFKDPDPNNTLKQAYSSQNTGLETHFQGKQPELEYVSYGSLASAPSGGFPYRTYQKDSQTTPDNPTTLDWGYKNLPSNAAFPYALVFKNPKYWQNGWTGDPKGITKNDLVPNDSRMYQAKLVLWRILQDKELLKGLRFGLATTFLSPSNGADPGISRGTTNSTALRSYTLQGAGTFTSYGGLLDDHREVSERTDFNGLYRVEPFGSNARTMRYFNKSDGEPSRYVAAAEFRPRTYPKEIANYNASSNAGGITRQTHVPWPYTVKLNLSPPNNGVEPKYYTNGILTSTISGYIRNWGGIHGQFIPMWMNAPVGLNYSMNSIRADNNGGSEWNDRARSLYRVLSRGSLHVPIMEYDAEWEKLGKDGTTVVDKITHADKFRLWINGFANLKSGGAAAAMGKVGIKVDSDEFTHSELFLNADDRWNQFHFYKDPEIGIAGSFSLPMAIFPDPRPEWKLDRGTYLDNGWIWYSAKDKNVNYWASFIQYSSEIDRPGIAKAFFNAGSGEATGSVLDFFSPPVFKNSSINFKISNINNPEPASWWDISGVYDGNNAKGNQVTVAERTSTGLHGKNSDIGLADLADVSFPIRSSCEDNWVILITSGQEIRPDKKGAYQYTAVDAIKNLYEFTRDNKVVMLERDKDGKPKMKNGNFDLKEIFLDNPIRTKVIGLVMDPEKLDKTDPSYEATLGLVKEMRENIVRMARAGIGDDPDDENSEAQIMFADNVETLFNNVKAALVAVNESQVQQPGIGSMTETPPIEGEVGTSNMFATTYRIVTGNQWDATLTRYVVSEDNLGNTTVSADWELGRNLLKSRGNRKLKYWGKDGASMKFKAWNGDGLERLLGMTNGRVTVADLEISGYSPPMEKAFYHWFQGYDFSYKTSGTAQYPRSSMLADLGKSGVVYGDYPKSTDTLPGYEQWGAQHSPDDSKLRLYAQGNDGILHVINPKTGEETDAILLPPVLLPWRLATLKTEVEVSEGKIQWKNVEASEKAAPGLRSNPSYILDGSLQKRRFDMKAEKTPETPRDWGTYLIGTMGKAGNGLYMLKLADQDDSSLTDPSSPEFVWYREKLGDTQITMNGGATEPSIVPLSDIIDSNEAGFSKLGYNSPKPGMGVTGWASDGKQTNFVALAGGTQSAYDPDHNGREGATLLFLDARDGKVLRAFDSQSLATLPRLHGGGSAVEGKAPYMGMMVSEPTLFRSDLDNYRVGKVYAADNRGSIFRVRLERKTSDGVTTLAPSQWEIDTIASLQESQDDALNSTNNYSVPHGLIGGTSGNETWLAGGTADVGTKVSNALIDGVIENKKQMIFAFRDNDELAQTEIRPANWKQLSSSGDETLVKTDGKSGWFIPLEEDDQDDFREYVSSRPMLVSGVLFVPTFIQKKPLDVTDASICGLVRSVNGESRLYAIDLTGGGGVFWEGDDNPKYITIDGIKITGMNLVDSKSGRRLVLRYDILSELADFLEKPKQKNVSRVAGVNNLIQIRNLPERRRGGGIPPETTIINYWIMK
jgi:hypothetical protein